MFNAWYEFLNLIFFYENITHKTFQRQHSSYCTKNCPPLFQCLLSSLSPDHYIDCQSCRLYSWNDWDHSLTVSLPGGVELWPSCDTESVSCHDTTSTSFVILYHEVFTYNFGIEAPIIYFLDVRSVRGRRGRVASCLGNGRIAGKQTKIKILVLWNSKNIICLLYFFWNTWYISNLFLSYC